MKPTKAKTKKEIKAWAVCFALNKRCMTGELCAFNRRKNAKEHIIKLHKEIGGLEDDHHIVPCTITYSLPPKPKKK
jgi:hypothetical protein